MTAPGPPAEASVGTEAVEVAAQELYERLCQGDDPVLGFAFTRKIYLGAAEAALAAALPHLRAQFLAEVAATLRDLPGFERWLGASPVGAGHVLGLLPDYLRDMLTPEETP